jgi:hypothetical protein
MGNGPSRRAGAVHLLPGALGGQPEGWLSLPQVCEALNTREWPLAAIGAAGGVPNLRYYLWMLSELSHSAVPALASSFAFSSAVSRA